MNIALAALVSFHLYTGIPHQHVFLASSLMEWDPQAVAMNETSPGDYSLSLERPWLHELPYKFVVDGKWMADPGNPNKRDDGHGGYNSILDIPDFAEDPLLSYEPGVSPLPQNQITVTDEDSLPRVVTILVPDKWDASRRSVIVYFQDGDDYLNQAHAGELLANLSRKKEMPQFVGVFVPPRERYDEYSLTPRTDAYVNFVVNTVVPAAENAIGHVFQSSNRMLIGESLGGLVSVYTALLHPEVFGIVGSQSGSFMFGDDKVQNLIRSSQNMQLDLFLEAGNYEDREMMDFNRGVFQLAQNAGLKIVYREYPSTHEWVAWRNRLGEIFTHFFKKSARHR